MFKILPFAASRLLPAAAASAEDAVAQGEKVFTDTCFECHNATAPNPDIVAPPIFAAKNHYAGFADRADFVAAVSSYLLNPTEEKARMPGAVMRFGIMPPPDVTEEEAIAWPNTSTLPIFRCRTGILHITRKSTAKCRSRTKEPGPSPRG